MIEQATEWLQQAEQENERSNYANALTLLEQALSVFETNGLWEQYVKALTKKSECLYKIGTYYDALETAKEALSIGLLHLGEESIEELLNENSSKPLNTLQKDVNSLQIAHNELSVKQRIIADAYTNLGACYLCQANYNQTMNCFDKAMKIWLMHGSTHDISSGYNNLGACYLFKGDYENALQHLNKSLQLKMNNPNSNLSDVYSNLGTCFFLKGDFPSTITFFNKALQIRLSVLRQQHPDIAISYCNLGRCYLNKKDCNTAIYYEDKALQIRLLFYGEKHFATALSYNRLSECYRAKGDYDKALHYADKALQIRLAVFGELHPDTANSYANFGNYCVAAKEHSSAINYFQKALHIEEVIFGRTHPKTAQSYCNLADVFTLQAQYTQALQHYQLALQANFYDFDNNNSHANPPLEGQLSSPVLLDTLRGKANCLLLYYQNQTRATTDLNTAIDTFFLADSLIDQMRNSFFHEGSKLALGEKAYQLSETALAAVWALQEEEKATPTTNAQ